MAEEIFVCPEGEPSRVDKILSHAFPGKSRAFIQKAIEKNKIKRADGTNIESKTKLNFGERLLIDLTIEETIPLSPKNISIKVNFEDEDILVIEKESGMVVHPGDGTSDNTLVHAMLHHYPDGLCPVGAPERPGIVHRLDKETSGVMVVAKSEIAYHSLVDQFSHRKTEKEYRAIVIGDMEKPKGKIDQPIGRHPKNRVKMAVVEHGKNALTEWEKIMSFKKAFNLLKVKIHTGRTHQIRVHFSHIGHPLAGDKTYGAKKHLFFDRVMLHAYSLSFFHPVTQNKLFFKAGLPKEFENSLSRLAEI